MQAQHAIFPSRQDGQVQSLPFVFQIIEEP
jgi:hypothetical protein